MTNEQAAQRLDDRAARERELSARARHEGLDFSLFRHAIHAAIAAAMSEEAAAIRGAR